MRGTKSQNKEHVFLDENAKRVAVAELMFHKRKSKKCYASLQEINTKCTANPHENVGIYIDYMANISLPCIPVQDTCCLRQLTVNVQGNAQFLFIMKVKGVRVQTLSVLC